MYKLHLILKYLRKRRIAWVSLFAVMLCTAMVLVVISVMGGWLNMFKERFKAVSSDIVVYRPGLTGFAGYEEMIGEIKALPEVDETLPLIRSFALMRINGHDDSLQGVQVTGMDLARFSAFNGFRESLWRQYQQPKEKGQKPPDKASFDLLPDVPYEAYRPDDVKVRQRPGIIVGGPLVGMRKDKDGKVIAPAGLYDAYVRLDVVPISNHVGSFKEVTPTSTFYWIVDASRTQLWQLDQNSVYVPFDVLQKDLGMKAQEYTDADTNQKVTIPARCSELQVKLKPGADRNIVLEKVKKMAKEISAKYEPYALDTLLVQPWEQQQATFLDQVEKEKLLITVLFGFISIVAVFLIFCILYMIVMEKTRDIGILKAVGATSEGVATIFMGYGLAIGVVGAGLGLLLAWGIVRNINEIHTFIGKTTGVVVWNPEVYAFDTIPSEMDPLTVVVVVLVAILSAIIGAVVPAYHAARLNPVESLRFE